MQRPSPEEIVDWFSSHELDAESETNVLLVRKGALAYATILMQAVPPSADRTAALRKLREVVWTANSAIAIQGPQRTALIPSIKAVRAATGATIVDAKAALEANNGNIEVAIALCRAKGSL